MDDASTDETFEIINEFKDNRIRCFRNKEHLGIAKSRNIAFKHSSGKYIFLTDADCIVNKEWIEEGIRCLEAGYAGVEGKLIYVSENYHPTFSTQFMENVKGGQYMSANVAYRRDLIMAVGGFDENVQWYRDRILGFRIAQFGRICFNERMVAIHSMVVKTPIELINSARRVEGKVYLFKMFGDRTIVSWRIFNPFNLAKIFFPPLILMSLLFGEFKTKTDFRLLPFTYLFALIERFHIWKASAKYHVFLI